MPLILASYEFAFAAASLFALAAIETVTGVLYNRWPQGFIPIAIRSHSIKCLLLQPSVLTTARPQSFTILQVIGVTAAFSSCLAIFFAASDISPQRSLSLRPQHSTSAQCSRNLQQIARALRNYYLQFHCLPPRILKNNRGTNLHSWRTLLLPYFYSGKGDNPLEVRLSEAWDSAYNIQVSSFAPGVYRCPNDQGDATTTSYVAIESAYDSISASPPNTASPLPFPLPSTPLIVEVHNTGLSWSRPVDLAELSRDTASLTSAAAQSGHGIPGSHGWAVTITGTVLPFSLRPLGASGDRADGMHYLSEESSITLSEESSITEPLAYRSKHAPLFFGMVALVLLSFVSIQHSWYEHVLAIILCAGISISILAFAVLDLRLLFFLVPVALLLRLLAGIATPALAYVATVATMHGAYSLFSDSMDSTYTTIAFYCTIVFLSSLAAFRILQGNQILRVDVLAIAFSLYNISMSQSVFTRYDGA